MSFLGGIARSLINPATLLQLATGPAGWASLAIRTIGSQIAMNLVQQIGQRLGLPQSAIDFAQAGFANSMGMPGLARQNLSEAVRGMAQDFNFSPVQQGEMQRTADRALNDLVSRLSESEDFKRAKSSGGKEAGGWLMALASTLGDKLNVKAKQVQDLAGQITDKTPDKTAKFGAATQEFGILMNATNNAIKTLGEGLSTTARKG